MITRVRMPRFAKMRMVSEIAVLSLVSGAVSRDMITNA